MRAALLALAACACADDDVAAYFATLPRTIPHCASPARPARGALGVCVYVDPSGGLVHARDLGTVAGSGKQMLMDMLLRAPSPTSPRAAACRGAGSFCMVYTASGPSRRERPTLGFGKREPATQPGLLVPNPFFVAPKWWAEYAAKAAKAAAARPFDGRDDRVLFRGACGPGAKARLELLSLRGLDGEIDAGFTAVDGYETSQKCVDDLAARHGVVPAAGASRRVAPLPMANYSTYKYLLHMPGAATGSYSRNLQYLFSHGAVVLVWRHAAIEWYYRHLVDGVHYVAEGGPPAFDAAAACTCEPRLADSYARCAKCEITTKRGNTIAKFVGLVPKKRAA
ncbi:hypothetical protein JL722_11460 [Aureococcus anophagefferens]|nr:hypothetical protein JL722_11460 [Aureococcus anophagefferens]